MSFGLFIVFVSVFAPLIIWSVRNEDRLIDLEDKIIAVIKDSRAQAIREKRIHVVERQPQPRETSYRQVSCGERNFVA